MIKAHLKVRSKDPSSTGSTVVTTTTDLSTLAYPNTLLSSEEAATESNDDALFVIDKIVNWISNNLITTTTTSALGPAAAAAAAASMDTSGSGANNDVQELEEEQEVQEVEMSPGEDVYDPTTALATIPVDSATNVGELLKLTASTLYYSNQQKVLNNTPGFTMVLDNAYLVHLLAINKIENVFRVKQIHDYYGGCFVCGQKVEFNMKHYQVLTKDRIALFFFFFIFKPNIFDIRLTSIRK